VTYGQLGPYLDGKGFALHNLASLPHISVAGACSTATHGSGEKSGNLASAVAALEMVTANGEVVKLSRKDGDVFRGAVVGLGALGAITKVTLDIQPTYTMRQYVYENLPLAQMKAHFDEIESAAYSVSLFTDWQKQRVNEVWIKSRDGAGARLLRHRRSSSEQSLRRAIFIRSPTFRGELHGAAGRAGALVRAAAALPHGIHAECRQGASDGISGAAEECGGRNSCGGEAARPSVPHLLISEIRTIAADDLWMSSAYKRDSVAIHFTWKQDWPAVKKLLR